MGRGGKCRTNRSLDRGVLKAEALGLGCDGGMRKGKAYQVLGIAEARAGRWESLRIKANFCVLLTKMPRKKTKKNEAKRFP